MIQSHDYLITHIITSIHINYVNEDADEDEDEDEDAEAEAEA